METVRIGIVGYGYWGPNVVRNFASNPGCKLVRISDRNPARLEVAKRLFPYVDVSTEERDVTLADDIDAVAVITPVSTHFPLGMQALLNGKHLWLEKPMAHSSAACKELIGAARKANRIILVDHTYVYTASVQKIKRLLTSGEMGEINYIDSVRINLGLYQQDINVVWDLVPHDFAIVSNLLGRNPLTISAVGAAHHGNPHEDVAYIHADYGNGLLVSFHVNWLSPIKMRQMIFAGTKKMVVYNDLDPYHKIMIYDKGVEVNVKNTDEFYRYAFSYRSGDMYAPNLIETEALGEEVRHFIACCQGFEKPITSGEEGARVVQMLEAAAKSLDSKELVSLAEMEMCESCVK